MQLEFPFANLKGKLANMDYTQAKSHFDDKIHKTKIYILDRSGTRLVRYKGHISLDFWRHKDLMVFYPNGQITINFEPRMVHTVRRNMRSSSGGRITPASYTGHNQDWGTLKRINDHMPFGRRYFFYTYAFHTMMSTTGSKSPDAREVPVKLLFNADGRLHSSIKLGPTQRELEEFYSKEWKALDKPRRRGRYWTARVRNLYWDRSKCKSKEFTGRESRLACDVRRIWDGRTRIRTAVELPCGCRFYRKNLKFKRTVTKILEEPNSTVRTCMIRLYGVDKFFNDAGAKPIHATRGYYLLKLDLPEAQANSVQDVARNSVLHALKMKCSTTGSIYVSLVPNTINSVPAALDWMYQTRDYLGTIGLQT